MKLPNKMNRKRKFNFERYIYIILAWMGYTNLLTWYTLIMIDVFLNSASIQYDLTSNHLAQYFKSNLQYLESTLFGFFFGVFFILADELTEKTSIRKMSFGKLILIKSGMYLLGVFIAGALIYNFFILFGIYPVEITVNEMIEMTSWDFAVVMFLLLLGFILIMNFIIQINKKFGPGNLWKMITGRYHKPIEEERIFLFLDLNDSTTLTEQLGNGLYSRMLKSCYYDLTDIILNYEAEVYQYVGDEVVLTWPISKGIENLNCIKTFFAYEKKLKERKEFYHRIYGVQPEFKAGMDAGIVTVTEIGEIKREIAFHGDPLNTASRILDQCKNLQKKLLISEHIANKIELFNGFDKNYIGDVHLKGKKKSVKLFSIQY